jgi:hypothetical protein
MLSIMKAENMSKPEAATGQEAAKSIVDEKELLKRIPVSRRTLFNWRKDGKIPFINTGGRKNLYHLPSVERALLRMQKNGG